MNNRLLFEDLPLLNEANYSIGIVRSADPDRFLCWCDADNILGEADRYRYCPVSAISADSAEGEPILVVSLEITDEQMLVARGLTEKFGNLHADLARYLDEDCYCPGEIYDTSGFSYVSYSVDSPCLKLGENEDFIVCIARSPLISSTADIVVLLKEDGKIADATRYYLTLHNVDFLMKRLGGEPKHEDDYLEHPERNSNRLYIEAVNKLFGGQLLGN